MIVVMKTNPAGRFNIPESEDTTIDVFGLRKIRLSMDFEALN